MTEYIKIRVMTAEGQPVIEVPGGSLEQIDSHVKRMLGQRDAVRLHDWEQEDSKLTGRRHLIRTRNLINRVPMAGVAVALIFAKLGDEGLQLLEGNGLRGEEIASMYRLCSSNVDEMISKLRK